MPVPSCSGCFVALSCLLHRVRVFCDCSPPLYLYDFLSLSLSRSRAIARSLIHFLCVLLRQNCVCQPLSLSICLSVCLSLSICLFVSFCPSVFVCLCFCLCLCLSLCVCVCVCLSLSLSLSASLCMPLCLGDHRCKCACAWGASWLSVSCYSSARMSLALCGPYTNV